MTSLKLCSHRQYNDMFFFCLSINDKRTKEQNSVAFQRILLQNWNSGGDSLEKFPFKAHSHSAKLPLYQVLTIRGWVPLTTTLRTKGRGQKYP